MVFLHRYFLLLLLTTSLLFSPSFGGSPWPNTAVQRAQSLVSLMNLTEKLQFLQGDEKGKGYAGHLPANDRLNIPEFNLEDGPQGVADGLTHVTAFPSALTMAQTWNLTTALLYGKAMGTEQYLKGTTILLGPGTNIARVPWNGRLYEYYSEEGYLASHFVSAVIHGVQDYNNVSVCVKHFLANSQEYQRGAEDALIDYRTLHELYLPAYLAASDAGAGSYMVGTNKVNNLENSANEYTINALFNSGFLGFLMTDWAGIMVPNASAAALAGTSVEMPIGYQYQYLPEYLANGTITETTIDNLVIRVLTTAAALGLLETPSNQSYRNISSIVTNTEHIALAKQIAAEAIILLKNDIVSSNNYESLLPLPSPTSVNVTNRLPKGIAIIGDSAWGQGNTVVGCGSGQVQLPYVSSVYEAFIDTYITSQNASRISTNCTVYENTDFFQNGAPCVSVSGSTSDEAIAACCSTCNETPGCNAWSIVFGANCPNQAVPNPNQCFIKPNNEGYTVHPGVTSGICSPFPPNIVNIVYDTGSNLTRVAEIVSSVDIVLALVDIPTSNDAYSPNCEGMDRLNLSLPVMEELMLNTSVQNNPHTIAVIRSGGPVLMPWINTIPTIVQAGLSGQEAGNAVASVLIEGGNPPSGKLTISYPPAEDATWLQIPEQYPGIYNSTDKFWHTNYIEGLFIGYRYYDAMNIVPLFPFGHGLGYVNFTYSNLTITNNGILNISTGSSLSLSFTVCVDTFGNVPNATEVAQLYIAFPPEAQEPPKLLRGFQKLFFVPSIPCVNTEFTIDPSDLNIWMDGDAEGIWQVIPGSYTANIGSSSRDIRLNQSFLAVL